MSHFQTPRILPCHLPAFHPSNTGSHTYNVRILGTITALQGGNGVLTCGPYGEIAIVLKPDARLQVGKLVELMGKVVDSDNNQVCFICSPATSGDSTEAP